MILNVLLFLVGLGVYAGYGLWGFAYLAGAMGLAYGLGRLIPRYKWLLWPGVAVNGLWLLLLKLQPVTGISLLAPLGISYFTLRIISYLADVYRGDQEPEKNLFRFGLVMTYLPHLFLGPIEPYGTMAQTLFQNRKMTWEGVGDGLTRVLWGGFKKLVIASRLGVVIGTISADPAVYNGAYALAAMLLYSIQLYADFSGGIDMVLGVSRMLGIRLSENFESPYLSQSIAEFWRRWHITLGAWFRKYVYIPLGGSRKGAVRKAVNTMVVFLVSGIWHGIEYLLWGVGHGIGVLFGTKLQTKWKLLNRLGTTLVVSLLWAFFIWPTAAISGKMLLSVFTTFNYGTFFTNLGVLGLTVADWITLGAAVVLLTVYDGWTEKWKALWATFAPWKKTAVMATLGLLLAVFGMYGIGFSAESFIYSRF